MKNLKLISISLIAISFLNAEVTKVNQLDVTPIKLIGDNHKVKSNKDLLVTGKSVDGYQKEIQKKADFYDYDLKTMEKKPQKDKTPSIISRIRSMQPTKVGSQASIEGWNAQEGKDEGPKTSIFAVNRKNNTETEEIGQKRGRIERQGAVETMDYKRPSAAKQPKQVRQPVQAITPVQAEKAREPKKALQPEEARKPL